MEKVVVITGPTASGKTAVSVEVAKKLGGEIINADSMQIYKMCDIGSAKAVEVEKQGIIHHMIDILDPSEKFSTAEYKETASVCIRDILARGKVPVISGGTGLYIDSLVKNMDFCEESRDNEVRDRFGSVLEKKGSGALYDLLLKRDPAAAKTVHPNNTRRVIRYLEILDGFEGTLKEYMAEAIAAPGEYEFRIYVLWPHREFIYGRIESRVEKMLERGLEDEVRNLIKAGIKVDSQSMMGIGYKETYGYINGRIEYDEFIGLLKRNTRRYAKRQFTWMKRYKDAKFIEVNENTSALNLAEIICDSFNE